MPNFSDISSNNEFFRADIYKAAGRDMIGIKATEGSSYVNPQWAPWTMAAHDQGLRVVHYHYAGLSDSSVQAQMFLHVTQALYRPGDVFALDLEYPRMPSGRRKGFAIDFLGRLYGERWLYSFKSYLQDGNIGYIGYPLWLANFSAPSWNDSLLPAGYTRNQRIAWQYTDRAHTPGVGNTASGGSDDSHYYGTTANRFEGYPTLETGSTDSGPTGVFPDRTHPVHTLQNALNITLGIEQQINPEHVIPDGNFGPHTAHAVFLFQENDGLTPDMIVGPITWAALDRKLDEIHR
ncbi:GH25 family lysozyme [Frankia sp. CiP3]|uniref:GH25 family lysozyme n=1 Tax=Frankia sp. CiP3 TaxID=2880971 RepID=UPI001EF3D92E|nr:GH25 family lysozyme [Frankia sp. CiP3]